MSNFKTEHEVVLERLTLAIRRHESLLQCLDVNDEDSVANFQDAAQEIKECNKIISSITKKKK